MKVNHKHKILPKQKAILVNGEPGNHTIYLWSPETNTRSSSLHAFPLFCSDTPMAIIEHLFGFDLISPVSYNKYVTKIEDTPAIWKLWMMTSENFKELLCLAAKDFKKNPTIGAAYHFELGTYTPDEMKLRREQLGENIVFDYACDKNYSDSLIYPDLSHLFGFIAEEWVCLLYEGRIEIEGWHEFLDAYKK